MDLQGGGSGLLSHSNERNVPATGSATCKQQFPCTPESEIDAQLPDLVHLKFIMWFENCQTSGNVHKF